MGSRVIWPRVWVRMCTLVVLGFFCVQINATRYGWRHSRLAHSNKYTSQVSVASYGSVQEGQYQKKSFASKAKYFLGNYLRFFSSGSCGGYRHCAQEYSPYEFLNFNTQDFALFFGQQIARGITTESDILRLYQLYSNSHFLAYLTSLPGYQEHILKLDAELHGSKVQVQEVVRQTGFKEDVAKKFFAVSAAKIREKRAAQEQERTLRAQAAKFQQEELLRNQRTAELEHQQRATEYTSRPRAFGHRSPATLAQCVAVWRQKKNGVNGARYKKRLAAVQKLAKDSVQKNRKQQ